VNSVQCFFLKKNLGEISPFFDKEIGNFLQFFSNIKLTNFAKF